MFVFQIRIVVVWLSIRLKEIGQTMRDVPEMELKQIVDILY